MPFDAITRTVLEYYTAHPPATEDVWYGPWTTILTTPDLVIEVVKLSTAPLAFRIVLIVEIKNSQPWQSGIQALQR
jgi:hypothetical protein